MRPSALALIGKSISGSYAVSENARSARPLAIDVNKQLTFAWNFSIMTRKPLARALTSASS